MTHLDIGVAIWLASILVFACLYALFAWRDSDDFGTTQIAFVLGAGVGSIVGAINFAVIFFAWVQP